MSVSGAIHNDTLQICAAFPHVGHHFTGGQASASGADPDIEFFLLVIKIQRPA